MALPHVPYAATTNPQMSNLDDTFGALALCATIPCSATGTNAYALTPTTNAPAVPTYTDKQEFGFVAPNTSSGNCTLSVAGLAAKTLFKAGGVSQASTGDILLGQYYVVVYLSSLDAFVIVSAIIPPAQTAFPVLIVQDRKNVNVNGSAIGVNGVFADRDVNTVLLNTLVSGGSVSTPNILLPAGTFDLTAIMACEAPGSQGTKSHLFNTNSSAVQQDTNGNTLTSLSIGVVGNTSANAPHTIVGRFTLAAQAQVRFRSAAASTGGTAGVAQNVTDQEIYLQATFTKVA